MTYRPIIGVPCDIKTIGHMPFHAVGDKYIQAIHHAVGDVVLLPALADQNTIERLLPILDGICLTGSLSNVEPKHYQGTASREGTLHDPARDGTTLPLIQKILAMGMPFLGICRGFQETNVALGGSLHQHVQELPNMLDHREPDIADKSDMETLFADAHSVTAAENSLLSQWLPETTFQVNSLHQQGVDRLAESLSVEAVAPDGLIEAFRVTAAKQFAYAVQWHPEWKFDEKPASIAIYQAFHQACLEYHANK